MQEFCQGGGGGGGGPGPDGQKTAWTTLLFFLVLSLFYSLQRDPMILLQSKLYFPNDQEGVQHFPGGAPTFSRRVQKLISIETHITCDFPGGGGGADPLSPLWIRT